MKRMMILPEDFKALHALVDAGRRAAALDGRHLLIFGALTAAVLALQYVAETRDWLPSDVLWRWQPAVLIGFLVAMFMLRRGAGRRLGHPVARAYVASFGLAATTIALVMLAKGSGERPDGYWTAVVVSCAIGSAYLFVGAVTPLRWMALPGFGWLALFVFYVDRQAVVPTDWLRLSMAFLLLMALPGAVLIARKSR